MLNAIVRPFLGLPSGCEGLFDLIDTHGHYCRLNHISVFVPQVILYQTQVNFSVNKTIYKEYKCLYEVLMRNIVRQCGCYPSYVR